MEKISLRSWDFRPDGSLSAENTLNVNAFDRWLKVSERLNPMPRGWSD
jgi:hypothetical protein